MTKAVNVQTTSVSANTSKIPHIPCAAGLEESADACAIGAEPSPASLEKIPLANPKRTACETVYPATPPAADAGVKAEEKIRCIASGSRSALKISTSIEQVR